MIHGPYNIKLITNTRRTITQKRAVLILGGGSLKSCTEELGYCKLCILGVPKMLTDACKEERKLFPTDLSH
jgi:hypothetical protein